MHSNTSALIPFLIFISILLAIDMYAWKGVTSAITDYGTVVKRNVKVAYWGISVIILLMAASFMFVGFVLRIRDGAHYPLVFGMVGIIMLFLIPKLVIVLFHLVEDMVWLFGRLWQMVNPSTAPDTGETLGRAQFISQLGVIVSAIPFAGILYGITKGRSNLQVEELEIPSPLIPKEFDGFRIVQLSDLHLGSLSRDNELVGKGVELIRNIRPDMILFTGDMVNDVATEVEPWIEQLSSLSAPFGKYSVLGNHDYSDYKSWDSEESKRANLMKLLEHQRSIGFEVLMDEHRKISKDGATITLAGVQNYGGRGFQKYGNLSAALNGVREDDFTILMSHDPSHWDIQVRDTAVDLTLSGHTHGMQMGVKIAGKRYSPVSRIYKQWAGLYENDGQRLYVNRGFGYIGFPGRVGMPPEITVLTLRATV